MLWVVSLLAVSTTSASSLDPLRVAFIGNSYTYFNDLPLAVSQLSASVGLAVKTQQSTPGGSSLFGHANLSTDTGKETAALLASGVAFDYVVLQDQSETPGGGRDTDAHLALGAARDLSLAAMPAFFAPRLAAANATALLYSTWGRRDPASEDPANADVYPDFGTMTALTTLGYQLYGTALRSAGVSVRVAPVGRAYELVYNESSAPLAPGSPFDLLYHTGAAGVGGHPSPLGTYLIANVFFAVLSGKPPQQATWRPSGISAAQQQYLQDVAGLAVFPK